MPPDERRGQAQPRPASSTKIDLDADRPRMHRCPRPWQTPSTFGLTPVELYAHAVELYANGWSVWEIRLVLELPTEVVR